MFGLELRNVHNRMEAGALRTNNSAEAFQNGFPTRVSGGSRQPLWTYVGNLHSMQIATDKDLSEAELGSVNPGRKKQAMRNQALWTLATRCLEDSDAPRLLRGVARNYLQMCSHPD